MFAKELTFVLRATRVSFSQDKRGAWWWINEIDPKGWHGLFLTLEEAEIYSDEIGLMDEPIEIRMGQPEFNKH